MVSLGRLMLARLQSIGSRNVCLPAGQVPGGPWTARGAWTYRTGAGGSTSGATTRAREMRSVTSARAYQEVGRADLFVQVIPFASPEDAQEAVAELRALPRTMRETKSITDVGEARDVAPPEITGATRVEAAEQPFVLDGQHARSLNLWCVAGSHVVVAGLGGRAEAVRWPDLAAIVEAQLDALG
ncbi:hypothetical protein [Terrabacter sp. NPDC080008]|uniref:SPOR domain-containing protein n=1 Tax=Terrabacter sp. NPDC080008 TaxID=3155176 RepID=UPI00344D09CB